MMKIAKATERYEEWLADHTRLVPADLDFKHQQMALGPFPFLRATFYRWVQQWLALCPEFTVSPIVLAIGDLHIENFGTWRDAEGRFVWGVNDFDEACYLPYANDLVRLAVSVYLAVAESKLHLDGDRGCDAILQGYTEGLTAGGKPFVLEEEHTDLRELARANLRDPVRFWQKMENLPEIDPAAVPQSAIVALKALLPDQDTPWHIKRRVSGLGSLGRARFVALMSWHGAYIARQVKALVPSAAVWAAELSGETRTLEPSYYPRIIEHAVHCPDPFIALQGDWIVRRLAPSCVRIELTALSGDKEEEKLLYAMGWETANIHLGSVFPGTVAPIVRDMERLQARDREWLATAARRMTGAVRADWQEWGGTTTK